MKIKLVKSAPAGAATNLGSAAKLFRVQANRRSVSTPEPGAAIETSGVELMLRRAA